MLQSTGLCNLTVDNTYKIVGSVCVNFLHTHTHTVQTKQYGGRDGTGGDILHLLLCSTLANGRDSDVGPLPKIDGMTRRSG